MSRFYTSHLCKALALVSLTLAMVAINCNSHYPAVSSDKPAIPREGSLARGRGLVMTMCAPCHYNEAAHSLIGKPVSGMPRLAGSLHSSNLTHSTTHGKLAMYSDPALMYLIRTGITRDGRFIPYMMRPNMADEDLNDIVVFLRSADPILQGRDTTAGQTRLTVAGRLGQQILIRPLPYRTGILRPAASDTLALGQYLVDNIGCFHCHSRSVMSLNYLHPELSKGYLTGGAAFLGRDGKVRIPNIRFDPETGIGEYSKTDLRRVLQQTIGKDGHRLRAPAEVFPVTDEESDAIYAYLKSLPPIRHKVNRRLPISKAEPATAVR